jgi:hypothetical protein
VNARLTARWALIWLALSGTHGRPRLLFTAEYDYIDKGVCFLERVLSVSDQPAGIVSTKKRKITLDRGVLINGSPADPESSDGLFYEMSCAEPMVVASIISKVGPELLASHYLSQVLSLEHSYASNH